MLYAIENGGFSGQIMPQNIVVGGRREAVARFLAQLRRAARRRTRRRSASGTILLGGLSVQEPRFSTSG